MERRRVQPAALVLVLVGLVLIRAAEGDGSGADPDEELGVCGPEYELHWACREKHEHVHPIDAIEACASTLAVLDSCRAGQLGSASDSPERDSADASTRGGQDDQSDGAVSEPETGQGVAGGRLALLKPRHWEVADLDGMVTIVAAVHELPAEIDAALKLDVILMNQNSGKKAVLAYSVPPADAPSGHSLARPEHAAAARPADAARGGAGGRALHGAAPPPPPLPTVAPSLYCCPYLYPYYTLTPSLQVGRLGGSCNVTMPVAGSELGHGTMVAAAPPRGTRARRGSAGPDPLRAARVQLLVLRGHAAPLTPY